VEYSADFTVPTDFGSPAAILITNLRPKEFHLLEIILHGFAEGPVFFPANTWIHSRNDNPQSRIIFKNQVSSLINLPSSYLRRFSYEAPAQTPDTKVDTSNNLRK
jgi:hypothetical protein